jgi:hypothetical protein
MRHRLDIQLIAGELHFFPDLRCRDAGDVE